MELINYYTQQGEHDYTTATQQIERRLADTKSPG